MAGRGTRGPTPRDLPHDQSAGRDPLAGQTAGPLAGTASPRAAALSSDGAADVCRVCPGGNAADHSPAAHGAGPSSVSSPERHRAALRGLAAADADRVRGGFRYFMGSATGWRNHRLAADPVGRLVRRPVHAALERRTTDGQPRLDRWRLRRVPESLRAVSGIRRSGSGAGAGAIAPRRGSDFFGRAAGVSFRTVKQTERSITEAQIKSIK